MLKHCWGKKMIDSPLDRLARRYPTLDMTKLKLLAMVADYPGCAICDLAEELGTEHNVVQFHISILASSRKDRAGLGLLTMMPDPMDKRRKQLHLSETGKKVFKTIKSLTVGVK